MKRLLILIPLVFLCCLGCQQGEKVAAVDNEADIQAIKDGYSEWEAGVNAADIDRSLSSIADDVVLIPPNEPAIIGKDAFRSYFQQIFDAFTVQEKYVVKDVKVSGDLAFTHFTYSGIYTLKANGESFKTEGNGIEIIERQPDGVWKTIYSICSDEGLVRPPLQE
jgi:uncharacterized protein (TIGR02246 family)